MLERDIKCNHMNSRTKGKERSRFLLVLRERIPSEESLRLHAKAIGIRKCVESKKSKNSKNGYARENECTVVIQGQQLVLGNYAMNDSARMSTREEL